MLEFRELWKGEYLSIVSPIKYQYEAVHEKDVITVLPVVVVKSKFVKGLINYYLVIRKEVCPPYLIKDQGIDEYFYTPITGKMDKEGESSEETMKRELIEEAGIELVDYEMILHKKKMPVCKTSDMRMDLFILLVNSFNPVEPVGDGTEMEKISTSIFVKLGEMHNIIEKPNVDFLLYGSYKILMDVIKNHIRI
jgi:8-oxo-dGTP pyrophosphatase MutT (NUDIX family)